jgi:hypothetical protein
MTCGTRHRVVGDRHRVCDRGVVRRTGRGPDGSRTASAKSAQSVLGETVQWNGFYLTEPLCGGFAPVGSVAHTDDRALQHDAIRIHGQRVHVVRSESARDRITVRGPGLTTTSAAAPVAA